MASVILPSRTSLFTTITILISFLSFPATGENSGLIGTFDRKSLGLKKEKISHFRLYWHDIASGRTPTSVTVLQPVNGSTTGFGMLNMIDNPLTIGPKLSSKLVGKAQGFYSLSSQQEIGLLMAMNFAFIEGKYNGSTITVLGRNTVNSPVREMPVIGGSGLFRWARGYVQAKTYYSNATSHDAIVQYNIYVMHY